MKIRNGFVSNSSSSSFVLFGVKIKSNSYENVCRLLFTEEEIDNFLAKNYDWYEIIEEYDKLDMLSDGYSGDMYFGKTLTYTDEELNDGNLSIEEMLEVQNKIKDVLPDYDCKLYFGTLGC
jgi:hypothetical protein